MISTIAGRRIRCSYNKSNPILVRHLSIAASSTAIAAKSQSPSANTRAKQISHHSSTIAPATTRAFSSSRKLGFATPTSIPPSSTASAQSEKPSPGPTSLSSSLQRLLPPQTDSSLPSGLERDAAEQIVQITLQALLESTAVSSLQQGKLGEEVLRRKLLKLLPRSEPLSTLHNLALHILRASSDPRKHPIAHRLFHISSGLDPYEFALGWSSSSSESSQVFEILGLDGSPRGSDGPLENLVKNRGEDSSKSIGSNLHAPSLSLFSSLVLASSAPPPPGTSSLPDKNLQARMRLAQRSAALRIYARLAEAGEDAGALFGWGMARLQALERSQMGKDGHLQTGNSNEKELREILGLWQKAAEKGVKEGWFELGRIHLAGVHLPKNEKLAMNFFEKGAEAGNIRSHHALGVLHAQVDSPDASISASEKAEELQKSYHHFLAAAEMGDAQSSHNIGVRHLLVEVPFPQEDSEGSGSVNGAATSSSSPTLGEGSVGMSEEEKKLEEALRKAIVSHEQKWGVKPDDEVAKKWFGVASKGGFVPSMLNLASLLISGRGSGHVLDPSTIDPMPSSAPSSETQLSPRLEELKQAETLYMRVIGMNGLGAQFSAQGEAKTPNQEMAEFAQEALEGVREMIQEEMKKY